MDNVISFITANFVAREVGYQMEDWGHGDRAVNDYFRPEATYRERLAALLDEVAGLGFTAIELWQGHLNHSWATDAQIATARALLAQRGLQVTGYAGWGGSTPEAFERYCQIAAALGAPLLAGSTPMLEKDREFVVERLQQHGLKLALENHPEKNPAEMLAKVGDGGEGTIGVCVDTGWFGTQGYDAAAALRELSDHLFHVHLKDVAPGPAHVSVPYGQGVVPLRGCVAVLREIGYTGAITVEHEPEHEDPTGAVREGYRLLQMWMEEE
jgi:L-ribulose-5-phosphate 3-epimerase